MPSRIRAQDEADFWRELRREFTIPRHEAFFNTGTLGASPKVVQQAVIEHLRHVDRDLAHWDYQPDHEQFFTGYFPELRVREKVGAVINAAGRDVALTQNATFGMNFVAQGLDLAPGDEVVVTDQAHPGGRKGYDLRAKRHGIVLREIVVPDPPESPEQLVRLFLDATTERTRVWAIPHISSARAIRYPVGTLCRLARERGIWSVVDGAQSAGHLRVDVRAMGCDAFFGSPHKWLLAPKGTGFLYIRPERQREVWATLASGEWDNQDDPMFRLMQYGTGNLSLLRGLEKALEFHLEIGSDRIERRIMGLADRLRTGLAAIPRARIVSPTHPELTCATTVYRIDGIPAGRVQDWLWERGRVRVRSVGDTVGVRHGCHIYNSEAEVDRALELLAELART
ncbi:MAG TPA: aminotransferase class V-fold PLP-dependent enzyme [Gemmatimonadales bacterium]|nr:aminotransferase class V-fold PLP-dependent enzyme [Gemmatimonadales bacterium]